MALARALVGHFHSSSQASEILINLQYLEKRPLNVIQDVVTRWWSTWLMISRLLKLKIYFDIMESKGMLACNLSPLNWDLLKQIEAVLKPFMLIQRLLEGQKYPTLSFVSYLISHIRTGLEQVILNHDNIVIRDFAQKLLTHAVKGFNTHWGSGVDGTVFIENFEEGARRRQKGLPVNTLLAALIDPRMKNLDGLGPIDTKEVHNEMKSRMRFLIMEANIDADIPIPAPIVPQIAIPARDDDDFDDLFMNIGQQNTYIADNFVVDEREMMSMEALTGKVKIEFETYLKLPRLPIKETDNETFTCPLQWWKKHEKLLPTLSQIAKRLLCIPATSAPSERVFSAAGLTIANDRASLMPDHAADMIFLRMSWDLAVAWDAKRQK